MLLSHISWNFPKTGKGTWHGIQSPNDRSFKVEIRGDQNLPTGFSSVFCLCLSVSGNQEICACVNQDYFYFVMFTAEGIHRGSTPNFQYAGNSVISQFHFLLNQENTYASLASNFKFLLKILFLLGLNCSKQINQSWYRHGKFQCECSEFDRVTRK